VQFWDRLRCVQQQLEPQKRIATEPDVILHVPGKYLVVIEAKFGSSNSLFEKSHKGIKAADYFSVYRARESNLDPLNRRWIYEADSGIHDQLCRNAMYAHWLAGFTEIPILVNLVERANEIDVVEKMSLHLRPNTVSFRRCNWEDLYYLSEVIHDKAGLLRQFMETKTCGLKRAFALPDNGEDLEPTDTDREGNEFFSIVDGVKTDAHLHDEILNEVDPVEADKLARENAKEIGLSEEQILTLFGPPLTK
jgi:hypothetical protein